MNKLKPCPFCGGEPELKKTGAWRWIECKCGVNTEWELDKKKVIDIWNRRVSDVTVREDTLVPLETVLRNTKTGNWRMNFDGYYCSSCGYRPETTALPDVCPSCGSKME